DHDLIILGVTGRRSDPEAPSGPLADRILRQASNTVVLVRHRLAQNEEQAQKIWQQHRDLSATVDRWFAENTFSSTEFEDLQRLLEGLYTLNGALVVVVDTDIRHFHPRFVYGVLGPLLREPRLVYCKGFYRRPIQIGESISATGGGRVTELTARPLLNLFYPE